MQKNLKQGLQNLSDTLWEIEDPKTFKDFIEDIMTPKEIMEIKERIEILKHLKAGLSQREIADKLGVSITTVNRGSRILKWGTGAADKVVKAINE